MNQLIRITSNSGASRYFRWPYQAKIMKMFEIASSSIVVIDQNVARNSGQAGMLGIWNSPTTELRFSHVHDQFFCRVPRRQRLKGFLEELGNFLASLLGIVNGHVLRLLRPFADPLGGIAGCSICQTERLLSAIGRLNSDGFSGSVNRLDCALRCLEATLADVVDFISRFFGSVCCVMHDHVTPCLQAMKRILCTFADLFCPIDRSAS